MTSTVKPLYPPDAWCITETSYEREHNYRNETIFALSNGYIGSRGTFEEGYDFPVTEGLEGNFLNGFYDSEEIRYGEWNFGFPETSQSLLNIPNCKLLRIRFGEETFDLHKGQIQEYSRTLHLDKGTLTRKVLWTSPEGKTVRLETERFVSLADRHVMAVRLHVTPVNFAGTVTITSVLNGDVENHTRITNPLVDYGPFGRRLLPLSLKDEPELAFYQGHTKNSGLWMACGFTHHLEGKILTHSSELSEYRIEQTFTFQASPSEPLRLDKLIAYVSSDICPDNTGEEFIRTKCSSMSGSGYDDLKKNHQKQLADFWKQTDIQIGGDPALQQGIRFNLFHIMQGAGRDGLRGMGAKGLTGEGYEGHYFWDTEMYVLPVLIYTNPELAKALLDYRYATLGQARARARVLGHEKGALYPWRTINGEEASTYFPLGTAQYHINGDIAYAFRLYVTVSGDMDYLCEKAAEVLCETARVYADVGCFSEARDGKYCICSVTGPDEYNAIVDNNFYTNLIARETLRDACEALDYLQENRPDAYERLTGKILLADSEPDDWRLIADNMYFPYDEKRKIYPLDDGFLMRKPWDDSKIPPEKRHLLYENYHPLFIYRQRMSKQADAILGMYLFSHYFTEEELRRNYDFYQEVTLHHSSLSTCIFGILACRIGYREEAVRYFTQSARMDLDDMHANVYAGIHAANMAGTWQAIVNGFAGVRFLDGILECSPFLPEGWDFCSIPLTCRGSRIRMDITPVSVRVALLQGPPLSMMLCGTKISLNSEGDTYEQAI